MASKVEIDVVASADQAVRELNKIGESTSKLADSFTTFAGTAKRRMLEFGADAALQLGQKFAADVGEAMRTIDALDFKIDQVFGDSATGAVMDFAGEMESLFGVSDTSIAGLMADTAAKLDINMGPLLETITEVAGAMSLMHPEMGSAAELMTELSNGLATGEWGRLEDIWGDMSNLSLETLSSAEAMELLEEKAGTALAAVDEGVFENQQALNELKAAWEGWVQSVARLANDVVGAFIDIKDSADDVVDKIGLNQAGSSNSLFGSVFGFVGFMKDQIMIEGGLFNPRGQTTDGIEDINSHIDEMEGKMIRVDGRTWRITADRTELVQAEDTAKEVNWQLDRMTVPRQIRVITPPGVGYVPSAQEQQQAEFDLLPPGLAFGGMVPDGAYGLGNYGGGTLAMLHGHEAVIPLQDLKGMMGSDGASVVVNVNAPFGDRSSVGKAVWEALRAYERASGGQLSIGSRA